MSIPGVAHNSTTLIVDWERPLCDQGVLSGYELCYVESSIGGCNSNGIKVNITDPDQLSYTINDLSINTNYIVEVRGRTGAGLGDHASVNGSTDEDGELQQVMFHAIMLSYVLNYFYLCRVNLGIVFHILLYCKAKK